MASYTDQLAQVFQQTLNALNDDPTREILGTLYVQAEKVYEAGGRPALAATQDAERILGKFASYSLYTSAVRVGLDRVRKSLVSAAQFCENGRRL